MGFGNVRRALAKTGPGDRVSVRFKKRTLTPVLEVTGLAAEAHLAIVAALDDVLGNVGEIEAFCPWHVGCLSWGPSDGVVSCRSAGSVFTAVSRPRSRAF